MSTKELLQSLGIDEGLPAQQILERLQSQNLEYLERIEACTDPGRLAELKKTQKQIEDAVLTYSTGVSLERQFARQNFQTTPDAPQATSQTDPLSQAMLDYRAGRKDAALPVLEEYAKKGEPFPCIFAASILMEKGDFNSIEKAKRYLFFAAQQGDGDAALLLAQLYLNGDNTVSAQRWAGVAMERQVINSDQLLVQAYKRDPFPEWALPELMNSLDAAAGYDRRVYLNIVEEILSRGTISSGAREKYIDILRKDLAGDRQELARLDKVNEAAVREIIDYKDRHY